MNRDLAILIVEDDDGHARLIEKNLRRAGLRNKIVRFSNGKEVLDFLSLSDESHQPAAGAAYLLLLDVRLPQIDGIEVLRRMKQDRALQKLPVIMLTTLDDPRQRDVCHALGCTHCIVKPVEYRQFVSVLAQLGLGPSSVHLP